MNVFLRIYRSSAFLSVISVFDRLLPLILLPFLTQYLDTKDYGLLYTIMVVVAFMVPILTIGLETYQGKEYYKTEVHERKSLMGTYLVFQVGALVVLMLLSFPISLIAAWFGAEEIGFFVLALIFCVAVFQGLNKVLLGYFKISYSFTIVGINSVVKLVLEIGLTILLVKLISAGWESRIGAMLLTNIILVLIGVAILWKRHEVVFTFNKRVFLEWVKFGSPLIVHRLSGIVFNMSDRVLITLIIGASATGVYTVGYQLASVIGIVVTAINQGWSPWFYKFYNSGKFNQKLVNRYSVYIVTGVFLMFLVTTYFGPSLFGYLLDSDRFSGAFEFIAPIGLSYVFQAIYFLCVPFLMVENKTKTIGAISLISAIVNFVLNIILLKSVGPILAAYSTLISWFLQSLLIGLYVRKLIKTRKK